MQVMKTGSLKGQMQLVAFPTYEGSAATGSFFGLHPYMVLSLALFFMGVAGFFVFSPKENRVKTMPFRTNQQQASSYGSVMA